MSITLTDIIKSEAPQKSEADDCTIVDESKDIDAMPFDEQKKKRELERYSSDTTDRKWLAKWTAWIVSLWLFGVLIILGLNQFLELQLSDSVLIVLLGTTTLNVLGLSFIVLRGHFNSSQNK